MSVSEYDSLQLLFIYIIYISTSPHASVRMQLHLASLHTYACHATFHCPPPASISRGDWPFNYVSAPLTRCAAYSILKRTCYQTTINNATWRDLPRSLISDEGCGRPSICQCVRPSWLMLLLLFTYCEWWLESGLEKGHAPSLATFRQKLKTHLFRQSYPDIVL